MGTFRFTARASPRVESPSRKKTEQIATIILFLIPGGIIYVLFLLWPLVQAAYYSLYKWNGLGPATDFRGFGNYSQALGNNIFTGAIGHTLVIVALSLLIQLPLALALAIMVGRNLPGRAIFRSIFFLPYVFSEIITAILWTFVYIPTGGLANTVIGSIIPGYVPIQWLSDPNIALVAIFAVITWKYFGLHMILYMAGLQQVSTEIEEASRIDGASELQVLRYVTIPMIAPTIRLTVYLSVVGSLNQFVLVWVMTAGGPVNATQVLATYMYRFGIKSFNLGYGSAVAIIIFAFSLIFSLFYQQTIMRRDYAPAAE